MKVKDLEDIRSSLDLLIDKAKDSIKDVDLIELEKTAFHKFQKYVDGGLTIARRDLNGVIDKKEKAIALDTLSHWGFIKQNIEIFVEHQMQDQRDKINLH